MPFIVILSHQGGSFIDKIIAAASSLGIEHCIISSLPESQSSVNAYVQRANAYLIEKKELYFHDVKEILDNKIGNSGLVGFISVWEGYRPLMAALNCSYGFQDISSDCAFFLRDKLKVRNALCKANLSSVCAQIAETEILMKSLISKNRHFIKPRFGLGSVGAKELIDISDIDYIKYLQKNLKQDRLLSNAIQDAEFIVEDYINGTEFSAEVIVNNGYAEILAFHEKTELLSGIFTTTEPFCISPPQTMFNLQKAKEWLNSVISVLGVTHGCYHIEFKSISKEIFEIVEVNPRIGGALILESTQQVSGVNMLSWWIANISSTMNSIILKNQQLQPTIHKGKGIPFSAFRVYFSNMVGILEHVAINHCKPSPQKYDLLVQPGLKLSRKESEQYLAQALWVGNKDSLEEVKKQQRIIQDVSRDLFKFEVRPDGAQQDVFLIIDYNLNRKAEVILLAEKCFSSYGIPSILVTEGGKEINHPLIYNIIAGNIRKNTFAKNCIRLLTENHFHCKGGLVFSDDAVVVGSIILSHLGLITDDSKQAIAAFDKLTYRQAEAHEVLPSGVARPSYRTLENLSHEDFNLHSSWVIKPRCEGNNRGVTIVKTIDEVNSVVKLNEQYLEEGFIIEERILRKEEFSVDGVGSYQFITQKISLTDKYPLEIGQVQPAWLDDKTRETIIAANTMANCITGHIRGAYHNEIMISKDTGDVFVIEPNRRPGGMNIWKLILKSYGIDLYNIWLQNSFDYIRPINSKPVTPLKSSGMLMLPGPYGWSFNKYQIESNLNQLVESTWQAMGIFENYPKHYDLNFIVPEGFIFPKQILDGHSFMLSLCFSGPLDQNFSSLLFRFYETWNKLIHSHPLLQNQEKSIFK